MCIRIWQADIRRRSLLHVFHATLYWCLVPEKLASDQAVSPATALAHGFVVLLVCGGSDTARADEDKARARENFMMEICVFERT